MEYAMKIVGRRKEPKRDLLYAKNLLEFVVRLRQGRPLIPKGVHRFKTFDESNAWTLLMITRTSNRGHQK